jgi:hypothetical protein
VVKHVHDLFTSTAPEPPYTGDSDRRPAPIPEYGSPSFSGRATREFLLITDWKRPATRPGNCPSVAARLPRPMEAQAKECNDAVT